MRKVTAKMVINEGRSDQDFAMRTAATRQETAELWHRRFAHLGYDNLYKLQSRSMVDGVSVAAAQSREQHREVCEPRIQAKQHRFLFFTHSSLTSLKEFSTASEDTIAFGKDSKQEADTGEAITQDASTQRATTDNNNVQQC